MRILEAVCQGEECGEIFIPDDEEDLQHLQKQNGQYCGEFGIIHGEWVSVE